MVIVSGRAIKCPSAFLFLRYQPAPLSACLGDIATGATLYKVGQHRQFSRNATTTALRVCFFAKVKLPKNIKHYFGKNANRQNKKYMVLFVYRIARARQ